MVNAPAVPAPATSADGNGVGIAVEAPVGLLERATSPHTRRAYAMARRQLDAWLEGRPLDDSNLAAYPGAPSRGRPRARDRCNGGRHRQA